MAAARCAGQTRSTHHLQIGLPGRSPCRGAGGGDPCSRCSSPAQCLPGTAGQSWYPRCSAQQRANSRAAAPAAHPRRATATALTRLTPARRPRPASAWHDSVPSRPPPPRTPAVPGLITASSAPRLPPAAAFPANRRSDFNITRCVGHRSHVPSKAALGPRQQSEPPALLTKATLQPCNCLILSALFAALTRCQADATPDTHHS